LPANGGANIASDLVADELVDDAVVLDDDPGGDVVEAVQQGRELRRRHPLAESRRAADVGEHERDLTSAPPRWPLTQRKQIPQ
jgi:hypothetical protein